MLYSNHRADFSGSLGVKELMHLEQWLAQSTGSTNISDYFCCCCLYYYYKLLITVYLQIFLDMVSHRKAVIGERAKK